MKSKKILVWFRNDLRLHDNEMLVEAIAKSDSILPVYFLDPQYFEYTDEGTLEEGYSRVQFLLESVSALRDALKSIGGNLLVVNGSPQEHMPGLITQYDISEVYHHREVATKETTVSSGIEDLLWKLKVNLKHFIGHTLYNKEDLPFPIKDIPDVFTQFKKKTERDAIVKDCFPAPESVSIVEAEEWGDLPVYHTVAMRVSGGEVAGIRHLKALLEPGAEIYAKSNSRASADKTPFISTLSPWLAIGCLSPRKVYWAVKAAEKEFGSNQNFTHIILGLLWRDYFRFMFKKHTVNYFTDVVTDAGKNLDDVQDALHLQQWKDGNTGHPLIDKYMTELNTTGFIPHTARLLVATFLIYIFKLNWLDGAAYFEQKLLDYAPASNWGNWANIAMGGKDARSKSTFDLDKQIKIIETDFYAPS